MRPSILNNRHITNLAELQLLKERLHRPRCGSCI